MVVFWLLLFVLIFNVFIESIFLHKIVTPTLIINSVFIIWLIIGRIGYLEQFKPSYNSSIFIELNIIILDLFIILGGLKKNKQINIKCIDINFDIFLKIFRYLSFGISLLIFINLAVNLYSGSIKIENVRNISYSVAFGTKDYTKIYFNPIIYYTYQYLIRGFAFFDLTYSIGRLIYEKNYKISKLSLFNFILFILIMQSRIEFMKVIIFLIIFFLYANIKIKTHVKRKLRKIGLIVGIAIFITLSIRTVATEKNVIIHAFDSFIIDFSGSNYMFSCFYDEFQNGFRLKDSSIILKYLGGIGLLIELVLSFFGFKFDHTLVNNYLLKAHYIGSSDHYNAFYTIYFEFLNSGGIIGCVLFSAIFGYIIGRAFKDQERNNTLKSTYIASFITYVMAMGTYNYVLSGIYALMIITCIIIANDNIHKEMKMYV